MTSFPESASNNNDLEAGLTAIQQGNPTEAVSLLESYLNTQSPTASDVVKAQMGLVRAYVQVERNQDAIALCQMLADSPHEKVKAWATQMLEKLEPSTQVGFVPIEGEVKRRRVFVSPQAKGATDETPQFVQERLVEEHAEKQEERSSTPSSTPEKFEWRQAGRSQRWQAFKPMNPARLQWAEMGTAIALFGLFYGFNAIAVSIPFLWFRFNVDLLRRSAAIPSSEIAVWGLLALLIGLFLASTWILEGLLRGAYGMRSANLSAIAKFSPETHRLIQRFCQQRKLPIPNFGILPTQTPIALTYGLMPKFARIVVSEGLLEQLAEDEIAAIYASELGHIAHWNFCWMTWVAAVWMMPFTVYQQSAIASDWMRRRSQKEDNLVGKLLKVGADFSAILSAIAYGFFWAFRWAGVWLSKTRIAYSDRHANNLTGNPNGLARALVKLAIATAESIKFQQKTEEILEGFELLSPVGYRHALTVGSGLDQASLTTLLTWDQVNPDRHWLTLNNSHPLFGERLAKILSDAKQWQLEPEFDLSTESSRARKRIFQQGTPFFVGAIGVAIALIIWILAHMANFLRFDRLNWLASDYNLFFSFLLLGFGLGSILRFNRFFPELRKPEKFSIVDLMSESNLIPSDSQAICLEGILLGRSLGGNSLAQDLILQTESGLIKLHFLSQLGAVGNLLQANRLASCIGQSVTISGWFRRGATPWIDVDTIKAANRPIIRSGHAVWSAIVAFSAILVSLILML